MRECVWLLNKSNQWNLQQLAAVTLTCSCTHLAEVVEAPNLGLMLLSSQPENLLHSSGEELVGTRASFDLHSNTYPSDDRLGSMV